MCPAGSAQSTSMCTSVEVPLVVMVTHVLQGGSEGAYLSIQAILWQRLMQCPVHPAQVLADSTQAYHRPGSELSDEAAQARTSSARPLPRPSAASAPGSAPPLAAGQRTPLSQSDAWHRPPSDSVSAPAGASAFSRARFRSLFRSMSDRRPAPCTGLLYHPYGS